MLWLRSHIIQATDIQEVAGWYEKVLEKKPYFTADQYIGFDAGGFELGIFKRDTGYLKIGNNVEVYWWVEDIDAEFQRLQTLWAKPLEKPIEVGGGIIMATVEDPFNNIFGIIYNPTFKG